MKKKMTKTSEIKKSSNFLLAVLAFSVMLLAVMIAFMDKTKDPRSGAQEKLSENGAIILPNAEVDIDKLP